jgi:hypothetical protein
MMGPMTARELRDKLEAAFGRNPPGDDPVSQALRNFINNPVLLGKKKKASSTKAKITLSSKRKVVKK